MSVRVLKRRLGGPARGAGAERVAVPGWPRRGGRLRKRWRVGPPMPLAQAHHERLHKRVALAVFSSDAMSSVAYATEEILLVLVLAGAAAAHLSVPIALAI